jgi:hypothetical protein
MQLVLLVLLRSNFIDLFEIVLLFCTALCDFGRFHRRCIFFPFPFLFLFLFVEIIFFVIYVVFDGSGFGLFAVRSRLGGRSRRSLFDSSGLSLALLLGGRSFCIPLVACPTPESMNWR